MAEYVNTESFVKRAEQEIYEVDNHTHNREIWFGNGTEDSLTPYVLTSGNGVYGAEVLLLNTTDTPNVATKKFFDPHRIEFAAVDTATPYFIRIIWGSGTVGAAETAGQYTTIVVCPSAIGANINGFPGDIKIGRLRCGIDKVWGKCKNASNLATIDVFIGFHEYDR